jgi:hypothetical protein
MPPDISFASGHRPTHAFDDILAIGGRDDEATLKGSSSSTKVTLRTLGLPSSGVVEGGGSVLSEAQFETYLDAYLHRSLSPPFALAPPRPAHRVLIQIGWAILTSHLPDQRCQQRQLSGSLLFRSLVIIVDLGQPILSALVGVKGVQLTIWARRLRLFVGLARIMQSI